MKIYKLNKNLKVKFLFTILFFYYLPFSFAQNPSSCFYGNNTLVGKVILMDLVNPINGKLIKNALVLKFSNDITFISRGEDYDETNAKTNKVRIYGCLNCKEQIQPQIKYKNLINKTIKVKANFEFAPSGHYPLDVNIIEDFEYKIIQ